MWSAAYFDAAVHSAIWTALRASKNLERALGIGDGLFLSCHGADVQRVLAAGQELILGVDLLDFADRIGVFRSPSPLRRSAW